MKNNVWRVIAFVSAALLPVLLLRDFTPSHELRYLAIADDALEHGNCFTFHNNGELYADKPPLFFWFIMLGKTIFGEHKMWFLSLFSLIPAFITILTMDKWCSRAMDLGQRRVATLMLASCGLFAGLAVFLRMDMLMCMFIILSLHTFWQIYSGNVALRNRILFPTYIFLALFSKGPVGLLMPLVATVSFLVMERKAKEIFRYWGWLTWGVLALCCALWFGSVWLEGGAEYLNNLLFHQTVDRAVNAFHHKEPLWYYLVSIWWSMAPWSLLVIGIIVVALRKKVPFFPLEKFLLIAAASTFVMLSLSSSKVAVYLMPAFPLMIYVGVMLLPRWSAVWSRIALAVPASLCALGAAGAFTVGLATDMVPLLGNPFCIGAACVLFIGGLVSLWKLWKSDSVYGSIRSLAATLFAALFTGGFALPEINVSIGYRELCLIAHEKAQATAGRKIYTWNVSRAENMSVHLGYDIVKVSQEEMLGGKCKDGVIILKSKKIKGNGEVEHYLQGKESVVSGRHLIVLP